jgi:hypothetical protein
LNVNRFYLPLRHAAGLASLTLSLLLVAQSLGIIPDRDGAILAGRKSLCESIAIQTAQAAQFNRASQLKEVFDQMAGRNPDLVSLAIRDADGNISVESGNHAAEWGDVDASSMDSTPTHMRVPITLDEKLWGTVEMHYRAAACQRPLVISNEFAGASADICLGGRLRNLFRLPVLHLSPDQGPVS